MLTLTTIAGFGPDDTGVSLNVEELRKFATDAQRAATEMRAMPDPMARVVALSTLNAVQRATVIARSAMRLPFAVLIDGKPRNVASDEQVAFLQGVHNRAIRLLALPEGSPIASARAPEEAAKLYDGYVSAAEQLLARPGAPVATATDDFPWGKLLAGAGVLVGALLIVKGVQKAREGRATDETLAPA